MWVCGQFFTPEHIVHVITKLFSLQEFKTMTSSGVIYVHLFPLTDWPWFYSLLDILKRRCDSEPVSVTRISAACERTQMNSRLFTNLSLAQISGHAIQRCMHSLHGCIFQLAEHSRSWPRLTDSAFWTAMPEYTPSNGDWEVLDQTQLGWQSICQTSQRVMTDLRTGSGCASVTYSQTSLSLTSVDYAACILCHSSLSLHLSQLAVSSSTQCLSVGLFLSVCLSVSLPHSQTHWSIPALLKCHQRVKRE